LAIDGSAKKSAKTLTYGFAPVGSVKGAVFGKGIAKTSTIFRQKGSHLSIDDRPLRGHNWSATKY